MTVAINDTPSMLKIVPRMIEPDEPPEVRFTDWDIVGVESNASDA